MNILMLLLLSSFTFAKIDWQGHRGARGLYPENTINGMKEALKYPVNTLELDVVMSKDNKVVVSHEPWMNQEICLDPEGKKISGKRIYFNTLSYDEIKAYDCGGLPHPRFPDQKKVKEHKPLLSQLIHEIERVLKSRGLVVKYSIEIKSSLKDEKAGIQPKYDILSDAVMKEVLKQLPPDRFMIQSFDWRVLRHINQKYSKISLVALIEKSYRPEDVLKELNFTPSVFSPDYTLLKESDIKFFQTKKIKVIPWTVNRLEDMKKLKALGVDGIITDYPNLILNLPEDQRGETLPDCFEGENRFEGKCVKIPTHAVASPSVPGWVCKPGYMQKRSSCVKIKLPKNAYFAEDGKTWICEEGYERYRGRCKKKK